MTTRLRAADLAFWALLAAIVTSHAVVLWQSITANRLWEDEAFNLSVPLNLLSGAGYTSDGTLSGSTLTPFDPRISTGPVVLLPVAAVLATGIDLVVGGRIVPALFFVSLLIAVALLGRRVGGRWGALAAIAMPLMFTAASLPSPIQGPADVLGEIPAAALIAWSLVVLERRPWLAGLLIGLAVQAKYLSLLAVPAIVVGYVLLRLGTPWVKRIRGMILPAVLVVVPTVVVEVSALLALGPRGFWEHVGMTRGFLLDGGQSSRGVGADAKLGALFASWHVPSIVVVVVAIVLGALVVTAVMFGRRRGIRWRSVVSDPRAPVVLAAAVGVATYLAWWLTAAHLPAWVRHPALGIFAFTPVLAAAVVPLVRALIRASSGWRVVGAVGASGLVVFAAVSVAGAVGGALSEDGSKLAAQRMHAETLASADEEWIATQWDQRISLIVMSGSHAALTDAPAEVVSEMPTLVRSDRTDCVGPTIAAVGRYALCAP
ncbi:hypothetical protein LG315_10610 [Microbacterium marinum]|uniref:hypothetical protein n=1 Tax=Microbacterium marinum TaxID=421115 RepID=UPI00384D867B